MFEAGNRAGAGHLPDVVCQRGQFKLNLISREVKFYTVWDVILRLISYPIEDRDAPSIECKQTLVPFVIVERPHAPSSATDLKPLTRVRMEQVTPPNR